MILLETYVKKTKPAVLRESLKMGEVL